MNVLVYLVPMALGLGLAGLFAFLWALRSGQYSDVEGAALRVLSDDDVEPAHDPEKWDPVFGQDHAPESRPRLASGGRKL
jgi:cbb3-type cytochrome oxidase maturation protein